MNGKIPTPPPSENLAPSPISSSEKPEGKKGLLFEIIFVAVFITVLFGIFNYFNIIRFSEIFPNQLGFLPHRPYQQQSQQPALPTGGLKKSAVLPSKQAIKTLTRFIQTIVTPSFVPASSSNIVFVQGKTAKDDFLAVWETKGGKAVARFILSPDENKILSLFIHFDYNTNSSESGNFARETVSKYFLPAAKEEFNCKAVSDTLNYCESFWLEADGTKRGTGIQVFSSPVSKERKINPFFCQFSEKSESYSWKSCSSNYAVSGL